MAIFRALSIELDCSFDVRVFTLSEQFYPFTVPYDTTVQGLKELVQKKLRIPVDDQRFISGGKQLEDGRLLCDYDIPIASNYVTLVLDL